LIIISQFFSFVNPISELFYRKYQQALTKTSL